MYYKLSEGIFEDSDDSSSKFQQKKGDYLNVNITFYKPLDLFDQYLLYFRTF